MTIFIDETKPKRVGSAVLQWEGGRRSPCSSLSTPIGEVVTALRIYEDNHTQTPLRIYLVLVYVFALTWLYSRSPWNASTVNANRATILINMYKHIFIHIYLQQITKFNDVANCTEKFSVSARQLPIFRIPRQTMSHYTKQRYICVYIAHHHQKILKQKIRNNLN